jgi:phosphohistidine phosphatase SixA
MPRIVWLPVLLLVCLSRPAHAQVDVTLPQPRTSLPARELGAAVLLSELRSGGYVLYFRHAATDLSMNDAGMKSFEDCAQQRNLVERGRDDARAVGESIRSLSIPVGRVLASPFCRTVETAQLMFGRVEKIPEVRGGRIAEDDARRYAPLRELLSDKPAAAVNLVIVSHGNPFQAVAGPPYLSEGEAAVVRPMGESFEVIARLRVESWRALSEAAAPERPGATQSAR